VYSSLLLTGLALWQPIVLRDQDDDEEFESGSDDFEEDEELEEDEDLDEDEEDEFEDYEEEFDDSDEPRPAKRRGGDWEEMRRRENRVEVGGDATRR
jgi:hypothetical protein